MDGEIELISDGDGLAVIGESADVERFLASEGLSSRDLGLRRLRSVVRSGGTIGQTASEIAADSGRWVKLTKESAHLKKAYGLMDTKTPGVSHAMVGKPGSIQKWIQIEKGSFLTNPAVLTGAAGIMAQVAMQQTMDEITDYLATIDEKLDDVLRAQEDAVWADMIGVGFDIDEAMTIREHGNRVNEITWSKVQASSSTIARTQAYALRQLDALAEKVERKSKIGELSDTAKEVESKAQGWLAVLARSFQLQDAIAVLELDRVLDAAPEELDGHRLGLRAARQKRLDTILRTTESLMARMDSAASTANAKVMLHPTASPAVVQSREYVAVAVGDFHGRLGIDSGRESLEARRWAHAAAELRDKALESGAERVDASKRRSMEAVEASKRRGSETLDRAKTLKGRLSSELAERTLRRRGRDDGDPEEA